MKSNHLGAFLGDDGKTYEIVEEVSQNISRPLKGSPQTNDGFKSYRTSCGIPVNLKKGIYTTWDDVILTSVK